MKKIILLIISMLSLVLIKEQKIEGNIINIGSTSFTLLTNNGYIYKFNKNNDFNYNLNDNIELSYKKKLSNFLNIQNIEIKKIKKISNFNFINNSLFKKYEKEALEKLKNMKIEEKVGQLLLVRIPEKEKLEPINNYHIGGYILFGRDTKDKTKIELINEIKNYQNNSKIPLLIAIDEEGGTVSRLSSNKNIISNSFLSSQEIYKNNGFPGIKDDTINKNKILYELGINLNLAPVADVSTNENDYIYKRSFGKNAILTAKYIETVITNTDYKVSYTLKHFPGYGDNKDTHKGIAIDNRSYTSFKQNDFLPFIAGIKSNVNSILFSHNYMNCVDKINPASISPNVHNILKELNFNNITITDDLSMNGLNNIENKYLKAVLAGNNILIVTDYKNAYNEILNAYKNKQISDTLIDYLVSKNIAWKYYKELNWR